MNDRKIVEGATSTETIRTMSGHVQDSIMRRTVLGSSRAPCYQRDLLVFCEFSTDCLENHVSKFLGKQRRYHLSNWRFRRETAQILADFGGSAA